MHGGQGELQGLETIMARGNVHAIGEGSLGLLTGAFGAVLLFLGIVLLTLSLS
jgi:hypothetical protein